MHCETKLFQPGHLKWVNLHNEAKSPASMTFVELKFHRFNKIFYDIYVYAKTSL